MTKSDTNISFVVSARNDLHGGNFLSRFRTFARALALQADRFRLRSELVVVEWNPPAERPRLKDAFEWPSDSTGLSIRIIEVSPSLHKRYLHSGQLPLYQMIAKNVGIRRSHGDFVLATTADLLFSNELVQFLASGDLDPEVLYRVDRYDVAPDIPESASIDHQLMFCRQHVIRVLTCCQMLEGESLAKHMTPVSGEMKPLEFHYEHPYPHLHTWASGDFTLLAREKWLQLRGYPEFDMYSLHLDSLLLHMTHVSGIRELILPDPMRIYHIDHGSSEAKERHSLVDRLRAGGVPVMEWEDCESLIMQMYREKNPIVFNGEDWGLASESLPETTIR